MNYKLSVIMPALNEEKNIEAAINDTLKAAEHYKIPAEIIVINDGSTDNTLEIVSEITKKNGNINIISHDKPMGIGYSFWEGIQNAKGDVVTMFPGDNENDPYEILQYFDLMDKVDIIVPYIFNKSVRSFFRRILSRVYRFIINLSFGINLNYTNGTVLYRQKIFHNINLEAKGFFYQAELLIKTIRSGYLFAEVPCSLSQRQSGKTKAVSMRSLFRVIGGYTKTFYKIHILRKIGRRSIVADGTISAKRYKKLDKYI